MQSDDKKAWQKKLSILVGWVEVSNATIRNKKESNNWNIAEEDARKMSLHQNWTKSHQIYNTAKGDIIANETQELGQRGVNLQKMVSE